MAEGWRLAITGAIGALLVVAALRAAEVARGAALVMAVAGAGRWPERLASWDAMAVDTAERIAPSRHGPLRARVFRPRGPWRRAVLVAPGVHAAGIDEPRLTAFARRLAGRGLTVAAVELPDLRRYAVTPRTTDMIEDAARWLVDDVPRGVRVGVLGISFAGGLGIVAAGRPALRDRLAWVLSFGGHGDLPRTLRYLCTGIAPDGTRRPPHDYGVAIVLLGVADRLVPPAQVETLRQGIRTFLAASHADMIDKARARALFERARRLEAAMPEPAATLMRYVNTRDVAALGPLLLPHVAQLGGHPALSPERSPPPAAPVYLLHGADDNVIPSHESRLLAAYLEPHTDVRLLLTPLITHAEVRDARNLVDLWKLVDFWTDLLGE
jgi:dienelactone hydrolase